MPDNEADVKDQRRGSPLDSLPDKCDCVEAGLSMNRHRLVRVRNDKGVIRFCPVTRRGWIQYHSGFIIDGIFSGNRDGD